MTIEQKKMHLFKHYLKQVRYEDDSLETTTRAVIKNSEYEHYLKLLKEEVKRSTTSKTNKAY